jgi:alpha-L-fucosidase 2
MMIRFIFLLFCLATTPALAQQPLKLWYTQPAGKWTEAMPIGNGRLGAMVFGRPQEELIHLNEETLWSGGPANLNPNPLAPEFLPKVREALFKGDYKTAEQLCKKIQGLYTESYMPLGNLLIKHHFTATPEALYRDLDISHATTLTRFSVNGVQYTREIFASAPDQVIMVRLRSDKKGQLSFDASTNSLIRFKNIAAGENELVMKGKAPSHADPNYVNYNPEPVIYDMPCKGMRYELRIKAKLKDGRVSTDTAGLHITGATEAILYISAATSFNGFDKCPDKDESQLAQGYLNKAFAKASTRSKKTTSKITSNISTGLRFPSTITRKLKSPHSTA